MPVVACVGATGIIVAADSIPAIFAITTDRLIVPALTRVWSVKTAPRKLVRSPGRPTPGSPVNADRVAARPA